MAASQKYLHDKLILLLASVNVFLTFLAVLQLLLRLGGGHNGSDYIIQYRSNLGISAFKTGALSDIVGFALFMIVLLTINLVLSTRVYHLRRSLSLAVLSLGMSMSACSIIVLNSLLALR
jgi:hypothetical protein